MKPIRFFTRQRWGVRNRAPWLSMIGHALHQFHENDLFTPAAAMSYFGLLALFPALLALLVLSNKFNVVTDILTSAIEAYPGSRDFLRATIRSLENVGTGAILSCVVVTIWAGSWVFAVVERAINRIWGTKPRTFLHGRALTVGMIGAVGLLLSFSAFATSVLVGLRELVDHLPLKRLQNEPVLALAGSFFWQIIFGIVSLCVTVALFIFVYRFMPSGRVKLRDTIPGALVAGLLWEAAKYIFASSLRYFHYDQIYGSVGAVVAVLTWSYFSSLILMFGAQLSVVFHQEHPGGAEEEAVPVVQAVEAEHAPSSLTTHSS